MSIDSSVTTDAPVVNPEAAPDPEPAAVVYSDEDGATTPGGPTMIWIFTGIFVLVTWLRRRYRKRRENR